MSRLLLRAIGFAAIATAVGGCQSRPGGARSPVPQTPIGYIHRPTIDLSHGGAGFPVTGPAFPATNDALAAQMKAAYATRLKDGGTVTVTAEGALPTRLDALTIDLTGSTVKSELMNRSGAHTLSKSITKVHVDRLTYLADPLKYDAFAAGVRVEVDDADLAALPQDDGSFTLALYDCRRGRATLQITMSDLASGLLAAGKAKLKNNLTFGIHGVDVNLQSERRNTLAVDLTLHLRLLFVPATLNLHGRVTTAGNNVLFTELEASGRDPSGAIAAGFMQDKLDHYNRKIARLLRMPGDKVHITDLAFRVDDKLTVDVKFAGTKKPMTRTVSR